MSSTNNDGKGNLLISYLFPENSNAFEQIDLENQLYVYRTYSFYRCINESGAVAFPGAIAKYATSSLSETLSSYMRG